MGKTLLLVILVGGAITVIYFAMSGQRPGEVGTGVPLPQIPATPASNIWTAKPQLAASLYANGLALFTPPVGAPPAVIDLPPLGATSGPATQARSGGGHF